LVVEPVQVAVPGIALVGMANDLLGTVRLRIDEPSDRGKKYRDAEHAPSAEPRAAE
jgi:hypothetical protein